ncbi:MAG TPA: hypothetical protein VD999_02215 [Vitreimonas sp.]|nr:hypothetical protein [Vitreimonas sp.]
MVNKDQVAPAEPHLSQLSDPEYIAEKAKALQARLAGMDSVSNTFSPEQDQAKAEFTTLLDFLENGLKSFPIKHRFVRNVLRVMLGAVAVTTIATRHHEDVIVQRGGDAEQVYYNPGQWDNEADLIIFRFLIRNKEKYPELFQAIQDYGRTHSPDEFISLIEKFPEQAQFAEGNQQFINDLFNIFKFLEASPQIKQFIKAHPERYINFRFVFNGEKDGQGYEMILSWGVSSRSQFMKDAITRPVSETAEADAQNLEANNESENSENSISIPSSGLPNFGEAIDLRVFGRYDWETIEQLFADHHWTSAQLQFQSSPGGVDHISQRFFGN